MNMYSAFPELNYSNLFFNKTINNYRNFNLEKKYKKIQKEIYLSEHEWLTSTNYLFNSRLINKINKLDLLKNNLTSEVNDKNYKNFKLNYIRILNIANQYKKNIKHFNKIKFFNQSYQTEFLRELIGLFKLLKKDNCNLKEIHNYLKEKKFIFKGTAGVGMNYYVGYKYK